MITPIAVHKTVLTAIGLVIEAPASDPYRLVPAGWHEFFARQHELEFRFQALAVRLGMNKDLRVDFLGALVPPGLEPPPGLRRLTIPANRYLRVIHEGPLTGIPAGFDRLKAALAEQSLKDSGTWLDIGYSPGLPAGRHELYIGIARFRPAQLGPIAEPPAADAPEPDGDDPGEAPPN
jgi:hypothetical protein